MISGSGSRGLSSQGFWAWRFLKLKDEDKLCNYRRGNSDGCNLKRGPMRGI